MMGQEGKAYHIYSFGGVNSSETTIQYHNLGGEEALRLQVPSCDLFNPRQRPCYATLCPQHHSCIVTYDIMPLDWDECLANNGPAFLAKFSVWLSSDIRTGMSRPPKHP